MKPRDILTPRTLLRVVTPEILEEVFTQFPIEQQTAFFGVDSEEGFKQEKERYKKGLTTFNKSFRYFYLLNRADNRRIGWCGFHTWYLDHNRAEIGYAITDDRYKGQGIMTEAFREVIRHGFSAMNLNRIEAFISPENTASIKLVAGMKFIREGHMRQHFVKNGIAEDSLIFSLLKDEFVKRSGEGR